MSTHTVLLSRNGGFCSALSSAFPSLAATTLLVENAGHGEPWLLFESLVERIEEAGRGRYPLTRLGDCMVLVDGTGLANFFEKLNPVVECSDKFEDAWPVVVAMLTLAFPEVYWVYLVRDVSVGFRKRDEAPSDDLTHKRDEAPPDDLTQRLHVCHIADTDKLMALKELHTKGFRATFDFAGLRDILKYRSGKTLKLQNRRHTDDRPFRRRKQLAICLDDESEYAKMHGYYAYWAGLRSISISTQYIMKEFLGRGLGMNRVGGTATIAASATIEDLYLNTPDHKSMVSGLASEGPVSLSDLKVRYIYFPVLGSAEYRIVVSTDIESRRRKWRACDIDAVYSFSVEETTGAEFSFDRSRFCRPVSKPYSGVYGLDKVAKIELSKYVENRSAFERERCRIRVRDFQFAFKKLWWSARGKDLVHIAEQVSDEVHRIGHRLKNAAVWVWGSERRQEQPPKPAPPPHSAPGRLLAISEALLSRGRRILSDRSGVESAVQGAVLAIDAKELVRDQTPTTSLELLQLQHEFEVQSEVAFLGAGATLEVDSRLGSLERQVTQTVRCFSRRHRNVAKISALAVIVNSLAKRFRQANQFDEEQICLKFARKYSIQLRPALAWKRRDWLLSLLWATYGWTVGRYLNSVLSSVGAFIRAIVIWPLIFAAFYYFSGSVGSGDQIQIMECIGNGDWESGWTCVKALNWQPVKDCYVESVLTFFSASPSISTISNAGSWWWVPLAEMILGVLHVGVLISHLYVKLSRR